MLLWKGDVNKLKCGRCAQWKSAMENEIEVVDPCRFPWPDSFPYELFSVHFIVMFTGETNKLCFKFDVYLNIGEN